MNNYDMAVKKTAERLGVPVKDVRVCYKQFWKYIRDSIEGLPLMDHDIDKDEFAKLDTVFNIPGLCKIFCTYDNYLERKKKLKKRHDKNKKSASDVHGNTCDNG